MTRRTPALAAALLALGAVTACGGGDDSADAGGSASTPASSSTATGEDTSAAPSPSASSAAPSDSPDAQPAGSDKEYCDAVDMAQRQLADSTTASNKSVNQVARALDEITRLAPDDVRKQWQLVADTVDDVRAAVRQAGIDLADLTDPEVLANLTPAQQQALTKGLEGVDTAGLPQANQEISAQVSDLCGFALAPGSAVPTP